MSQTAATDHNSTPLNTPTRPRPGGNYIPEKSQKRNLSAGSTPSPSFITQVDKKHRIDTEFDWPASNMEPEVTMADLMQQLKLTAKASDLVDLATKKDVQEIQTTVTAHTLELKQIKDDLEIHAKRLQQLEDNLGRQAAASLNRTKPDVDFSRPRQDGGPHVSSNQANSRRRNLVFEGLQTLSDRDTIAYVIQLCSAIDIVAYQTDFESVLPMRRRDGSDKPPPVLITFAEPHVRAAILRKKFKLAEIEKYASIFINLDEPIEVRRAKAVFRRVGYQARQDGRTVLLRDDWIRIDDEEYRITDLENIPEKYRSNLEPRSTTASKPTAPNVKVKMTQAGLTFSGPTAFMSHMHRCSFVYKKIPYSSVEQGLQHQHALFEEKPDIAQAIMNIHEPITIKDLSKRRPKSEGWSKEAPGKAWELNEAKYEQNPDLKRRLLDTAPALLIEATIDSKWGGACPYGSDIYDQGQVPGANICGKQLTQYRDNILTEVASYTMS